MSNATTITNQSTVPLTEQEARVITDSIKENLNVLPKYVYRAMTGKAYLALGYTGVQEWAKAEFGLGRSRMYQFLNWQTVEMGLREKFDLADDWTVPEEWFRHLKGERYLNLLASIEKALSDAGDDVSQKQKGELIRAELSADFGKHEKERREQAEAKKREALKEELKAEIAAELNNADTDDTADNGKPAVDTSSDSREPKRIASVRGNYELLLVKARDTAQVLSSLDESDDDDTEITLAKLTDARSVLDSLIAYYSADEQAA